MFASRPSNRKIAYYMEHQSWGGGRDPWSRFGHGFGDFLAVSRALPGPRPEPKEPQGPSTGPVVSTTVTIRLRNTTRPPTHPPTHPPHSTRHPTQDTTHNAAVACIDVSLAPCPKRLMYFCDGRFLCVGTVGAWKGVVVCLL